MVAYRPHVAVGAGQVLGRPHCVGEAHIVKVEHVLHSVEAPHRLLLSSCLLVEALQFILNVLKQRIVKPTAAMPSSQERPALARARPPRGGCGRTS